MLNKRQKLFLKYHPVSILNHDFKPDDELINQEDINEDELKLILQDNNQDGLLRIDQKLIEQCIGKSNENRQLHEHPLNFSL